MSRGPKARPLLKKRKPDRCVRKRARVYPVFSVEKGAQESMICSSSSLAASTCWDFSAS